MAQYEFNTGSLATSPTKTTTKQKPCREGQGFDDGNLFELDHLGEDDDQGEEHQGLDKRQAEEER